jgi:hypothetical protein
MTNGSRLVAGMVLANAFSLAGFWMTVRMVSERFGERVAAMMSVLWLAFPGSLFFQFVYSESLFLLLVALLWLNLARGRYLWAALAALLLPLTRAVGLFCLLPIAWHLLGQAGPRGLREWAQPGAAAGRAGAVGISIGRSGWMLLAAPLAGWLGYLLLMRHWTGHVWEGFEAQRFWRVHSMANLWDIPKFVFGLVSPFSWHEFRGSALDRGVFLLLLYCLPLIWRLDKGLFVWALVLGVVPAMSGTFTSFTRFAGVVFPLFIALGVFLCEPRWKVLRWSVLLVFGALHLVLVWRFVNFRWAG